METQLITIPKDSDLKFLWQIFQSYLSELDYRDLNFDHNIAHTVELGAKFGFDFHEWLNLIETGPDALQSDYTVYQD